MGRTRYRIEETQRPYFLTCTIVGWLPVFSNPRCVEAIFDSWRFQQTERQLLILGYVIMENHLHLIAAAPELSKLLQQFKSYTAKKIIEALQASAANVFLDQLRYRKAKTREDSVYQVWQEGNHPQEIQNDEMMWQKLEYIHNNPLKRGYVDNPLHWRYSSARNYAGQAGLINVETDWR